MNPIEISGGVLYIGNALEELKKIPDNSVDCVITSPPYYMLRQYGKNGETECIWGGDPECDHEWGDEKVVKVRGDYSKANVANNRKGLDPQYKHLGSFCLKCGAWKGELGHEPDPDLFVSHLADIFDEVYRVLKPTGNLFLNMGDTYAGGGGTTGGFSQSWEKEHDHRPSHRGTQKIVGSKGWIKRKQLLLIPYRVAIELQMRGWIVRDMIVWAKSVSVVGRSGEIVEQFGNGLPESTTDRLTKSYEVIIHAVKSEKYYFNKPRASAKPQSLERMLRGMSENHKYAQKYGGGGGLNKPRPNVRKQYEGKFASGLIDPESVGSIRARVMRNSLNIPGFGETSYGRNVIQVNTEPFSDAHFAVMPTKLVRFLMKMGCPEKVCSECGKPYIIEEEIAGERSPEEIRRRYGTDRNGNYSGQGKKGDTNPSELKRRLIESVRKIRKKTETPSCDCNAPPCEAAVLDPFMGAGTVAFVAEELGRKWIGVEINPEYVGIIRRRLRDVQKVLF